MDKKQIKKIPYGISDYVRIRKENYYYVDKTAFLPEIEAAGEYLFFIRPRRFGKSLLINMIEAYYDIHLKDRFEELFKGTAIFENPTNEQGRYLVLSFNFSQVDAGADHWETSFLKNVQTTALSFINKYESFLQKDIEYTRKEIRESKSAPDIFSILLTICKDSAAPLYLVIDEYDNFANTIMTTSGEAADHALTHGEDILRSFFNMVKGATTANDAPLKRLFITGVSPVTMDDVTSGFNIGKNVSLHDTLNQLVGFNRQETETLVSHYRDQGLISHTVDEIMKVFDQWYGNYLFSDYTSPNERLFNSDMILYFLGEYMRRKTVPADLIDRNVRIDYGKLRHLMIVDGKNNTPPTINGNFSKLKQIMEDGQTNTLLVKGFPMDRLTHSENFKSLLFYFGLLTIKGTDLGETILQIPNETVRRLFYDYMKEAYLETGMFSLDLSRYSGLMRGLAAKGEWEPLLHYIVDEMAQSLSLRDLMTAEKAIQTFLNVYLGLSNLYIIHPEKELNKGYADLVMEPFLAHYSTIKYSCILEIKYLKAGAQPDSPEVKKLAAEARKQLKQYALDKKFAKTIGKTTLIKVLLVFSGHQIMAMEEVGNLNRIKSNSQDGQD